MDGSGGMSKIPVTVVHLTGAPAALSDNEEVAKRRGSLLVSGRAPQQTAIVWYKALGLHLSLLCTN